MLSVLAFSSGGHRLWHVAALLRHALDQGQQVRLITLESFEGTPDFRVHIEPLVLDPNLQVVYVNNLSEALSLLVADGEPKVLFDVEGVVRSLNLSSRRALLRLDDLTVQVMVPPEFASSGAFKSTLKAALLFVVVKVFRIRAVLLASPLWSLGFPSSLLTLFSGFTPAKDPILATETSEPDPTASGLLVPGGVNARKLVPLLIASWERDMPVLTLLGAHDDAVHEAIRSKGFPPNIVSVDRYVTDQELREAVRRSKYVWCVNRTDLSSGTAVQALSSGSKIIALSESRLESFALQTNRGVGIPKSTERWREFLSSLDWTPGGLPSYHLSDASESHFAAAHFPSKHDSSSTEY